MLSLQLSYDWRAKRLDFEFSLITVSGSRLEDDPTNTAHTEIVVPELVYPNQSYQVQISPPGLFKWRVSSTQPNVVEILPEDSSDVRATESVKVVIGHINAIL